MTTRVTVSTHFACMTTFHLHYNLIKIVTVITFGFIDGHHRAQRRFVCKLSHHVLPAEDAQAPPCTKYKGPSSLLGVSAALWLHLTKGQARSGAVPLLTYILRTPAISILALLKACCHVKKS